MSARKLIIVLILAISVEDAFSQFIARDKESYLNYSGRNYENYSISFLRKRFYDNFGNFLIDGSLIFELLENQRQFIGQELGGFSSLTKSRFYYQYFQNLVIASDNYSDFQTRLMIGDAIRTKFTSLTFDKARFNGIRWDGATTKYRGTFIASRVSDPVRFRFDTPLLIDGVQRTRNWAQYLFGGHFETDIGDVLTIGMTYVNQHTRRMDVNARDVPFKGVPPNGVPRIIFVRISDDSPRDGSGPIIYAEPVVKINGKRVPTKNINGKVPNPQETVLGAPIQFYVLRNFSIDRTIWVAGADTLSYTAYTPIQGGPGYKLRSLLSALPVYPEQIPSDGNITYAYIIPFGVESVEFEITVANDFKIEAGHDFVNRLDDWSQSVRLISHADSIAVGTPTFFRLIKRAEGNVKDASNKQVVRFNYALTTGMSVYSLNFKFNWKGFNIEGEFAQSLEWSKYPVGRGPWFTQTGNAFYIKASKKVGRLTFGFERYKIEPVYTTALNVYSLENSYYMQWTGSRYAYLAPDVYGVTAYDVSSDKAFIPGGAYFSLVDDNDDRDRWEDGFYFYNATPNPTFENSDVLNPTPDPFLLGYRQNANELIGLTSIIRRPDAGIFPGKDRNNDGIPDDDQNANGIPDFQEDFLTYYSDPPLFDYGDDWNNNGVIDEQENDIYPDYPYEPDINGYHAFTKINLTRNWTAQIGLIKENAIARGGINNVVYLKTFYTTFNPRLGSLLLYYVMKRVRDDIGNPVYKYKGVITITSPFPVFTEDPLNYRNSFVHNLYFETKYTQIPNLNIENKVRFELNFQYPLGDPTKALLPEAKYTGDQLEGHITLLGLVHKIDYTMKFLGGRLEVKPQFKVRTVKETKLGYVDVGGGLRRITVINQHTQETIPIFRVGYKLTDRTVFNFGLQGLTIIGLPDALAYRIRNLKDGTGSENRGTIAFSLTNQSSYKGYSIVVDFGYKFTKRKFVKPGEEKFSRDESAIFFTVIAGF
jgi:hypothetical protein